MATQILHITGARNQLRRPRLELRGLVGVSALLFVLSAALTVAWCGSMSSMGTMAMPGGWSMSMAWMRMPGQSWLGAAASFLGMWIVMMVAMMLPSLVPALDRYRQAVATAEECRAGRATPHRLTALVAAAYFFVWALLGVAVFPLGVALAALEMQSSALARCIPAAAGMVVLLAGALQFTAWKAHHLACCRQAPGTSGTVAADARTAYRIGLRLGLHCVYGCAGMTAILLVAGVMNLRAMAMVTVAISLERLLPGGERIARAAGAVAVAAGILLVARAAGMPL